MAGAQNPFVWYELMTADAMAAKAFYSHVVGWTMQDMSMPSMTYTLLHAGETQIGGLMAIPADACAAGMVSCWASYIAVDDVDSAAAKAKRLGGNILKPPADIPNVGRFAVVSDPQGAFFNLFKPNQAGQRVVSNKPGHIGWHELHTSDWPKAWDFYSEMFGWLKGDSMSIGPSDTYQLFTINDVPAGGMFDSPGSRAARFWLYYIRVGDIDAAAMRITEKGGDITQGPLEVPGDSWVVQAIDPQGAAFALVGTKN